MKIEFWNLRPVYLIVLAAFLSVSSVLAQSSLPLIYEENFESGSTNWSPNIPANWRDGSDEDGHFYELLQPGPFGSPRRPTSSSILTPYVVGDFELEVVAKSNADSTIEARDICLFFGFQDSLQFYYAHFAATSGNVHNIIAIVDSADRKKINFEPAGTSTALLDDHQFHRLKIVRSVESGSIEAFFDDQKILTAVDSTFSYGKIGIGSFDDAAVFRSVKLWGELITTGVDGTPNPPEEFALHQNYPNPFNPETTIGFTLAKASSISIDIFDLGGKRVKSLLNEQRRAGYSQVSWNGTDLNNVRVASGVYVYILRNGYFSQTRKMVLLQ